MHFAILIRKGFLGGAGFQGSNSWKTGMLELWKSILAEGGVWITAVSGRVAGRGFESKQIEPACCYILCCFGCREAVTVNQRRRGDGEDNAGRTLPGRGSGHLQSPSGDPKDNKFRLAKSPYRGGWCRRNPKSEPDEHVPCPVDNLEEKT